MATRSDCKKPSSRGCKSHVAIARGLIRAMSSDLSVDRCDSASAGPESARAVPLLSVSDANAGFGGLECHRTQEAVNRDWPCQSTEHCRCPRNRTLPMVPAMNSSTCPDPCTAQRWNLRGRWWGFADWTFRRRYTTQELRPAVPARVFRSCNPKCSDCVNDVSCLHPEDS